MLLALVRVRVRVRANPNPNPEPNPNPNPNPKPNPNQVNCGGILAWVCVWTRSSEPAPPPTAAAAPPRRRDKAAVHTWPTRANTAPPSTDPFYYWMRGLRFDPPDSCAEALAACAAGASGPGTPEVREQGESGGVREESQSAPGRAAADLQGAK